MSSTSSTYHRDGTVTLWDVYCQRWRRLPAANVTDQILATLSDRDRQLIKRMAVRGECRPGPDRVPKKAHGPDRRVPTRAERVLADGPAPYLQPASLQR
jgi:hypothetical protein